MEHAFTEEGGTEVDAIEPADEPAVLIGLDGVAMADIEEIAIKLADALVDPGVRRPSMGAAQAAMTASKSRSTTISKRSDLTVRAKRRGIRRPSSGITPRCSGSIQ